MGVTADGKPLTAGTLPGDDATLWGSAEELRILCDLTADALAVSDPDGIVLWANQAYFQLYGYGPEAVIGHDFAVILPEDERPRARAQYRATFHQPAPPPPVESTVWRADGSARVVEARIAYLTRDGQRIAMLSTIRDITESEARFRIMADTAPVLLWMSGPDGLCTFFNKPWLDFTGRTLEQEMGNGWAEGVHPEDLGRCLDTYRSAFDARRPFTMEYRLHHAEGTYRWVLDNGVPRFLPTGSFAGYIGSAIDITDRKVAEEELRRSEARFRRLDCSGMIGFIVADEGGRVVEANDAFLALVGYTREDLAAGRVDLADMTPPEHAVVDAEGTQRLWIARACQPYEQEYVRKDGRRVPVLVGGAALEEGAEGATPRVILFVLDLTERKRAETALRELAVRRQTEAALRESEARLQRANAELERASRLKSTFLANMSHESRTPLNGVLGLAHLLRDTPLDAHQQEYVAGIQSSGAALLALVSDILDLSKIEAGEMALERAPVDLRALVADVVAVVAAQVRAKELELVSFVDPAVPPVLMGDPTRLRQVLVNLVGNAVKFTERGGIAVRLAPANPAAGRAADEEGGLLIQGTVEDTGIGIPPEAQAHVFDAFAQADETTTRRHGGTGLGLAICKQLVELMGGEIGVESVLETGSTFWFTARLENVEAGGTHAPIPDHLSPAAPTQASARGGRILVAEDNPVNQLVTVHLVAALGYQVETVEDGRGAVTAVERGAYDLVLMDCHMPTMDGFTATAEIRRWEERSRRHTPIIALTADALSGDAEKCLAAGMDDYLAKPVTPERLLEVVARWAG